MCPLKKRQRHPPNRHTQWFHCICGKMAYCWGNGIVNGKVREIYWCDHCNEGHYDSLKSEIPIEGRYKGCLCVWIYHNRVVCKQSSCTSDCEFKEIINENS